ncbi:MAG TPA: Gfo/Idh/MocA family oxidoreductase [Bryobacteraceae bacterium]|nr:Gfo/Idh/MocA family oxidoreductase [Bryobacteraceae bacterium]
MDLISRRALLAGAAAVKLPRKLRLGMVGVLGHAGNILSPLPQLPDVELAAVAESDPAELAKIQKRPVAAKAKFYSDYRRMLDAEKLDLVGVCTSNGDRAASVIAVAERGLPLIAEKPVALNRADFEKTKRAVTKSGKPIWLILPLRYEPPYLAMRQLVRDGVVGEVGMISSQKSYKAGVRPPWMKNHASYGSTILWIGIHMFDLMRWTSGRDFTEAFSYQAQVAAPPGIGQMENTTTTILKMDNGGTASLHMDYYRSEAAPTHGDDRVRIAGSKGVIEYMAATGVTVLRQGGKVELLKELPPERDIFVEFLEAAFNGKPNDMPLDDVWKVNEITLAAHEAAELGRPVKIRA